MNMAELIQNHRRNVHDRSPSAKGFNESAGGNEKLRNKIMSFGNCDGGGDQLAFSQTISSNNFISQSDFLFNRHSRNFSEKMPNDSRE
mmetsp:Transcript_8378/g.14001  ORF Transcript_8378/g.14001 Transcript_8378/m.14001 type:complete len:88 (-) Transcript_8378:263-526(-)